VLKEKFMEITNLVSSREDLKRKLKGSKMRLTLRLRGTPPFTIYIEPEEVYLENKRGGEKS